MITHEHDSGETCPRDSKGPWKKPWNIAQGPETCSHCHGPRRFLRGDTRFVRFGRCWGTAGGRPVGEHPHARKVMQTEYPETVWGVFQLVLCELRTSSGQGLLVSGRTGPQAAERRRGVAQVVGVW